MAAGAVAPLLEMLVIAVFTAQFHHLAPLVDRPGRATPDTGLAAAVEGVQAVAISFRIGTHRRCQLEGSNDAADPAIGSPLGDQRLLQAKSTHSGGKGHVSFGPERQPAVRVVARIDVGGVGLSPLLFNKAGQTTPHDVEKLGTVPLARGKLDGRIA